MWHSDNGSCHDGYSTVEVPSNPPPLRCGALHSPPLENGGDGLDDKEVPSCAISLFDMSYSSCSSGTSITTSTSHDCRGTRKGKFSSSLVANAGSTNRHQDSPRHHCSTSGRKHRQNTSTGRRCCVWTIGLVSLVVAVATMTVVIVVVVQPGASSSGNSQVVPIVPETKPDLTRPVERPEGPLAVDPSDGTVDEGTPMQEHVAVCTTISYQLNHLNVTADALETGRTTPEGLALRRALELAAAHVVQAFVDDYNSVDDLVLTRSGTLVYDADSNPTVVTDAVDVSAAICPEPHCILIQQSACVVWEPPVKSRSTEDDTIDTPTDAAAIQAGLRQSLRDAITEGNWLPESE